jgi:hypothetical protein
MSNEHYTGSVPGDSPNEGGAALKPAACNSSGQYDELLMEDISINVKAASVSVQVPTRCLR